MTVFDGDDPALPDQFDPYVVVCARCGAVGNSEEFVIEEGDEWECPPCWERCNAAELAAHKAKASP